jgi:hypothetical protein
LELSDAISMPASVFPYLEAGIAKVVGKKRWAQLGRIMNGM